jgi:hypothetical protein
VVFEHAAYGRAEYDITLELDGEQRLHHVFEEAPAP